MLFLNKVLLFLSIYFIQVSSDDVPNTIKDEGLESRAIVGVKTGRNACKEHFTCLSPDRSLENLQKLKLNSLVPNWYELCNCDAYCHVYGDCCSDAPVLANLETEDWSFVKVRYHKTQFPTLLRSKCSKTWNDTVIRRKCEYSRFPPYLDYLMPDIEQFMLVTPEDEFSNWHVTGRESLITYKNIYCAQCNYDDNVESWIQKMKCKTSGSDNMKIIKIDGKDNSHKCSVVAHQQSPELIILEKLKRMPLQTRVYGQCSLGWYKLNLLKGPSKVLDTIKRCIIFYEPVVVQDPNTKKFIIFKNRHCAECNDYEESEMQCPKEQLDQPIQLPATKGSRTMGFDTNTTKGSLIDSATNASCPPDSVFNPLIRNCQGMKYLPAKEYQPNYEVLEKPSYASPVVGDAPSSSYSLFTHNCSFRMLVQTFIPFIFTTLIFSRF